MKRAAAILAVIMACLPAVGAEAFSASSMQARWASFDAAVRTLEYGGIEPGDAFELEAAAVRLETDSTQWLMAGEVAYGTRQPQTDTRLFAQSTWTGRSWDRTSDLFLMSHDASLASPDGQGNLRLPSVSCVARPTYFATDRPPDCPGTQGLVDVVGTSASWVLRGNFTLVLWGWQATENPTGTQVWGGTRPTSNSVLGQGEVEMRLVFLFVTEGMFRLQPRASQPIQVHAARVALMTDAPAIVADGRTPDDNVSGVAGGADVLIHATPASLLVDTRPSALIGPDPRTGHRGSWPAGVVGASTTLLPLLALAVWRHRGLAQLVRANENLEMRNHLAAARHAAWAARRPGQRGRACLVGAVACLKSGNLDHAERFLAKLHRVRIHDEAACRYLWAHLRVKQGRNAEGQALLDECLGLNRAYGADAAIDPVLGPHLDPSLWPGSTR